MMPTSTDAGWCNLIERVKPAVAMILVQSSVAGVNIFYKLAIKDGMSGPVLVCYRYFIGAVVLIPLAIFFERSRWPRMTWSVLLLTFLCGFFGGAFVQNLYFEVLRRTTATFASATANMVPFLTFTLTSIPRLGRFSPRTRGGLAKSGGILVGFGGAMVLMLYKGVIFNNWRTDLEDHHSHRPQRMCSLFPWYHKIPDSLFSFVCCFSFAAWLMILSKLAKDFPCPFTSTAFMAVAAFILSVPYAAFKDWNDWDAWKLRSGVRLWASLYCGLIGTGLALSLLAWCIQKKELFYASAFTPLMLLNVAVLNCFLLKENIHVGTILGAVIMAVGLYIVAGGVRREEENVQDDASDVAPNPATNLGSGARSSNQVITNLGSEARSSNQVITNLGSEARSSNQVANLGSEAGSSNEGYTNLGSEAGSSS